MADNILTEPSTAGTAVPVATDDVGGIHYQVVKLAVGSDGSVRLVDDSAGMPVVAPTLEATQTEMLSEAIMLLSQIAAGLPRLTTTKQAAISIESIAGGLTLATVTTVSNIAAIGGRYGGAAEMAMAGTQHIYNNIQVS